MWRALLVAWVGTHGLLVWAGEPPAVASADGAWRLQGTDGALILRDAAGVEVRRWAAAPGQTIKAIGARRSYLIAFTQRAELWELQLDPMAEPIFNGWVHDYRMGEGLAEPGYLGVRRTRLPEPLHAVAIDRSGAWVLGRGADAADGHAVLHLVQLDVRRAVARFDINADPDLDHAHAGPCAGMPDRECLTVPDRRGGPALVLDVRAARLQHGDSAASATPPSQPR